MGKWTATCKQLPKLDPLRDEKPEYRERVRATKDAICSGAIDQLEQPRVPALPNVGLHGEVTPEAVCRAYRAHRRWMDQLDALKSAANLRLNALEALLVEVWEGEDVDAIKQEGEAVRIDHEPEPIIKDREAARLYAWNDPNLRQAMTLNPQTMKSLMKNKLQAGDALPEWVEPYDRVKIVWTK